jgi:hypothetical protein
MTALKLVILTAAWLLPIATAALIRHFLRENAKLTALCDDRTPEVW